MIATIASARTSAVPPIEDRPAGGLEFALAAVAASRGGAPGGSSSRWKRSRINSANPIPSARPVIVPSATPTGSSVSTCPSSATSPKPASRADRADGGDEQRRHGRAQPDQQKQEQDADGDQLGSAQVRDRGVLQRAIDRRLAGDVRLDRPRDVPRDEALDLRLVVRTTSFSGRSTETTIIAAVGFGRRPALARAGVPRGERRASGRAWQRGDQLRTLTVELRLRSLEQDRDQLGRTELGVGQLLGARRIASPARP